MAAHIRILTDSDYDLIAAVDGGVAWNADRRLWDNYLKEQSNREREVLLAIEGDQAVGYGSLLWTSNHVPFREARIPEINNLVVATGARRRGIATNLIKHFEREAREAGRSMIGIGVGLYANYGSAQRLYVRLGYLPDGTGVTYKDRKVPPGSDVRLDDHLVLWMVKEL